MTLAPAPNRAASPRLAVIGDVSGHLLPLVEQLIVLDVDLDTGIIPTGLTICQVGDLIHKGPDSDKIVALVDRLMTANPGQWLQLLGNHEAQYLPGGTQFWSQNLDPATIATLQRWWANGAMQIAAAFTVANTGQTEVGAVDVCPAGELLVTHAGLTAGAWRLLGRPASAAAAADVLNEARAPVVWREGTMITGRDDLCAGPLWAAAASEVVASWAVLDDWMSGKPVPRFAQAHGHTTAVRWPAGTTWAPPIDVLLARGAATALADNRRRITRVQIGEQVFFGTDPGASRTPMTVSVPLVLPLAGLAAS